MVLVAKVVEVLLEEAANAAGGRDPVTEVDPVRAVGDALLPGLLDPESEDKITAGKDVDRMMGDESLTGVPEAEPENEIAGGGDVAVMLSG